MTIFHGTDQGGYPQSRNDDEGTDHAQSRAVLTQRGLSIYYRVARNLEMPRVVSMAIIGIRRLPRLAVIYVRQIPLEAITGSPRRDCPTGFPSTVASRLHHPDVGGGS